MRSTVLWLGSLVTVAMLAGCVGRDLRILCTVAEEVVSDRPDLDGPGRGRLFAELSHNRLSTFGSVRKETVKAAMLPPGKRYRYLRQFAADEGHPEFDCPALKAVLEPEEVFDELVPD